MTQAQIQLQNALTTTFLANLAFLSEYDKELYLKVDTLSNMIADGTYKQKYELEFITEDGEFDLYDVVNDKYLYDRKPKKKYDELSRKVQFDEKNAIFDLPRQYLYKFQEKIDRKDRFDFEGINEFQALTFNDSWEYANITGDFLTNRKKRLKNIDKFIFIGTLVGRHIPRIANRVDARIYLVLEKNLEIFRLSLFTVDYTILAKNNGVIFSIMDDVLKTQEKIAKFINLENFHNYLLKISTTNINVDEYIDNILKYIHLLDPVGYDYNRRLYSSVNRSTKYVKSEYKFLLFNKIKESFNLFDNIPVLYLAAGPSLDENISWIKANQSKFFIVTIGAAYKKLLANDIKIDMITTLDESNILENVQFDDENVSKISQNTIILASSITNEKVLKKFNKENLFLYETFFHLHKDSVYFDGFSVGEVTLDILCQFNAKEIYLIGLDLALNQETGETHSKGSSSATLQLNLDEEQDRATFDVQKSLIKVKGNLKDEVLTNPYFFASINFIKKMLKKYDSLKIYNLSSHGAYFENTIPKKANEIEVDKKKIIENIDILHILLKYSRKKLSLSSKDIIKKEEEFLQKDWMDILDNISKKEYKTFQSLYLDIQALYYAFIEQEGFNFFQILSNYFSMIIPYLSYHFNDINVKNEAKKVEKIKDTFVKQMKNIIDDYTFCLKRVL